jgi:hypothetical protein
MFPTGRSAAEVLAAGHHRAFGIHNSGDAHQGKVLDIHLHAMKAAGRVEAVKLESTVVAVNGDEGASAGRAATLHRAGHVMEELALTSTELNEARGRRKEPCSGHVPHQRGLLLEVLEEAALRVSVARLPGAAQAEVRATHSEERVVENDRNLVRCEIRCSISAMRLPESHVFRFPCGP